MFPGWPACRRFQKRSADTSDAASRLAEYVARRGWAIAMQVSYLGYDLSWRHLNERAPLGPGCASAGNSWIGLEQWRSGAGESSVLDSVKALTLASRAGDVPVYYSACCKERAIEVQSAVSGALNFYKDKLRIQVDISAAVLDRKDWKRAEMKTPKELRTVYGMTHFAGPPFVAFIPADDAGVDYAEPAF
jgi:hypothetical protein